MTAQPSASEPAPADNEPPAPSRPDGSSARDPDPASAAALPSARQRMVVAGALLAGLAVVLGAFGTHGLRDVLDARALATWTTAVQYQLWHALALIALAGLPDRMGPERMGPARMGPGRMALPAALLGGGAVLFAGSLYLLALTDARWLGAVTPLGGLLMILGWLLVAWRAAR